MVQTKSLGLLLSDSTYCNLADGIPVLYSELSTSLWCSI